MRALDGWRLRVLHTSDFTYSAPARASYNEVRQIPVSTNRQITLESSVQTNPGAAQYNYVDYWGTRVVAFNVDGPHERLTIEGSSLVETHPAEGAPGAEWAEVFGVQDRHAEFLASTHYAQPDDELEEKAHELRCDSPTETVESVMAWVNSSLDYVPGATNVQTSALEAYESGSGVCQDFAHLALAVLRSCGIPARYVSGYLHPVPEAEVGTQAVGESHAWVEAWAGRWWGFDPTNAVGIGSRHIMVARGRDYADVAPVRGVFAGGSYHHASAEVRVTREA
jgi:transglutaminase-like putative cysteine protease